MVTVSKLCRFVPAMTDGVRSNSCMNADRATSARLAVATIIIAQVFLFEQSGIQDLSSAMQRDKF